MKLIINCQTLFILISSNLLLCALATTEYITEKFMDYLKNIGIPSLILPSTPSTQNFTL